MDLMFWWIQTSGHGWLRSISVQRLAQIHHSTHWLKQTWYVTPWIWSVSSDSTGKMSETKKWRIELVTSIWKVARTSHSYYNGTINWCEIVSPTTNHDQLTQRTTSFLRLETYKTEITMRNWNQSWVSTTTTSFSSSCIHHACNKSWGDLSTCNSKSIWSTLLKRWDVQATSSAYSRLVRPAKCQLSNRLWRNP